MESSSLICRAGSLVRIGHRPPEPVVGGSNPSPPATRPEPIELAIDPLSVEFGTEEAILNYARISMRGDTS